MCNRKLHAANGRINNGASYTFTGAIKKAGTPAFLPVSRTLFGNAHPLLFAHGIVYFHATILGATGLGVGALFRFAAGWICF